jgi:uncharacterized membrane protein
VDRSLVVRRGPGWTSPDERDLAAKICFDSLRVLHRPADPAASPSSDKRWLALDVFRALAVLWMIQGHTFTALLGSGDVFGGGFGQVYRLLHGLTAPMFLAGAGFAYGIVRFGAPRPPAPGRMLRRAALLWAIGTVLQLPAADLLDVLQRRDLLAAALQPGALQLVAACLVLAELLRSAVGGHNRVRFAVATGSIGLSVALLAPWIWRLGLSSRLLLGSWLDGQTGAQFPCVPWISFYLLGATIASLWGERLWRERWRVPLLGVFGLCVSALCYGLFLAGERLTLVYGEHAFWFTSPLFSAFRAGLVLAWLGLLSAASAWISRAFAAWPGLAYLIAMLSRHSLVAYVVHLSVLYGVPMLRARGHYTVLECSAVCAMLLWLSVLSVLHWERARALVASGLRAGQDRLSSPLAPRGAAPRDPLA